MKRTCSYTNPFRRTTINVSLWTDTRVCKHASITELTPSEPSCQDRSHTLQVDASRAHSFLKRRLASKFPRRNADERENKTTRARRSREDEPKESHGRFPEKKMFWWHLGRHLAGDTLRMRTSARGGMAGHDLAYSHMQSYQLSYPSRTSPRQMLTLSFSVKNKRDLV